MIIPTLHCNGDILKMQGCQTDKITLFVLVQWRGGQATVLYIPAMAFPLTKPQHLLLYFFVDVLEGLPNQSI